MRGLQPNREAPGARGRPVSLREPFKGSARWRRRVAAWVPAELRGSVAMDVGADEFEQSLPLLQELVQGADFVGKARGLPAWSQGPPRWGACGGGWGQGGEVRPGRGSR